MKIFTEQPATGKLAFPAFVLFAFLLVEVAQAWDARVWVTEVRNAQVVRETIGGPYYEPGLGLWIWEYALEADYREGWLYASDGRFEEVFPSYRDTYSVTYVPSQVDPTGWSQAIGGSGATIQNFSSTNASGTGTSYYMTTWGPSFTTPTYADYFGFAVHFESSLPTTYNGGGFPGVIVEVLPRFVSDNDRKTVRLRKKLKKLTKKYNRAARRGDVGAAKRIARKIKRLRKRL